MKEYQITVLKGDGIGPEIVDQAIKVLNKTAEKFDFKVNYQEEYIGGALHPSLHPVVVVLSLPSIEIARQDRPLCPLHRLVRIRTAHTGILIDEFNGPACLDIPVSRFAGIVTRSQHDADTVVSLPKPF